MSPQYLRSGSLWLLLLIGSVACNNAHWAGPESIESLRVLGVQAEPPTLTPGATTELMLHCADGRRGSGTDPTCQAEIAWFGECHNPPENDPKNCLDQYASWGKRLNGAVRDVPVQDYPRGFAFGARTALQAPEGILVGEQAVDGHTLRYGVSYVYFAVCGGELVFVPDSKERMPVECRDPKSQEPLGHEHFVVGVTSVFSYDGITTQNPEPRSYRIDHQAIPDGCGADSTCPQGFECSEEQCVPVVAACAENSPDTCREHCLDFALDLDSFSLFSVDGERLDSPRKSLWLDYFANAGGFDEPDQVELKAPSSENPSRRVPCIPWEAPSKPTENAHVWAVVRDNRGGLSIWDQRVIVR